MKYTVEESTENILLIMKSGSLDGKYSKSKSLTLNCQAKNVFKRYVSLGGPSVGLEPPVISFRV